jgi:hypothetical protein
VIALRRRSWRVGLTHIRCACGRSLDWMQPEFLAVHPEPVCWTCPAVEPPGLKVVRATAEVLSAKRLPIEQAAPFNAAFEVAVAEAEEVQR